MKISTTLTIAVLSAFSMVTQAADKAPPGPTAKESTTSKSVCKKGEIGGIVASNMKLKDGSYRTVYVGDKTPFNTPADGKDVIAKVAKLKTGDKNCVVDDGS